MAFPISKQVLLASPVPLSSENLNGYLCAPTGSKCNLSMGLFPLHQREAVFPQCVQDSRAHPRYNEHLWQLSSSILFPNSFVSISRADPVPRGSPCVDPLPWPRSVEFHGTSMAGLSRCSLLPALLLFSVGLRKREQPMHPHKGRVFPWGEAEKSVKKQMPPGKPGKVLQSSCLTRSLGFTCSSGKSLCRSPVGI